MAADTSIMGLILGASFLVQLVMLILVAASVLSWYLIFAKRAQLRGMLGEVQRFEKRFWSGLNLAELYRQLERRGELRGLEGLFQAGFREFVRGRRDEAGSDAWMEGAQRAMRAAQTRELERLERNLPVLATIGSTSPYIGLFGTVWGIMHAFQGLAGVQTATLDMVAPGIAEALVATALGLFAAIPAVIAYNRFGSDVDRIEGHFETFQDEFTNILQHSSGRGAGQPPGEEQ